MRELYESNCFYKYDSYNSYDSRELISYFSEESSFFNSNKNKITKRLASFDYSVLLDMLIL
jgi:hypothetical protein